MEADSFIIINLAIQLLLAYYSFLALCAAPPLIQQKQSGFTR